MALNKKEVRFENRRILPAHVAKYKFLFHDSLGSSAVFSKLQNGGSKTSVNGSYPYKLNDEPSVFFLKNGGAMFGGGDSDDYGGGGGGGGGGNFGSNYNADTNYGSSFGGDSTNYNNFYANQEQERLERNEMNERNERIEDTRTSRLADVETYSYSEQTATLPLGARNTLSTPETPVVVEQPRPERDDTQPSPPNSAELGANTNPYLEQDLAIHNSEDSPVEDKIISFDTDCACPEILNADSLNNRDNENNDGSAFHELSALNHIAAEKQASNSETKEDSCAVDCLYFTLQCCECTIL